jgi:hypothetical protein
MFENASKSRSRLKELLLLLGLVGSVWSSTQVSAIDRCPDYVANHGELYLSRS